MVNKGKMLVNLGICCAVGLMYNISVEIYLWKKNY